MIEFHDVSKTYRALLGRSVHAVESFSLQIAEGEVLGIAGPNGAGKTTLLAILLGFQHPTRGRVTVHGLAPRHYVERYGVGYLPELVHIVPSWSTTSALRRFAILAGVPAERVDAADVVGRIPLREDGPDSLNVAMAASIALY